MNDQQFENQMKKLKKQYDQIPQKTSSDHIMSQIKKGNQPRRATFFPRWQVAALMFLAAGIGAILLSGGFFTDQGNQIAISDEEINEESNGDGEANFLIEEEAAEEGGTDKDEVTTYEEPAGENVTAPRSSFERIDIGETREETVMREGQEDTIVVKEFTDTELGFSSVVDEQFDVEINSDEEKGIQIVANYGNGRIEPAFLSITPVDVGSVDEISEEWDLEMSHNGFALEDNETDWVNSRNDQLNVMEERFYIGEYESKRYALLSNDDHYYTIEIYTFGEYSEGLQVRAGQVIEHFEWTP
ncbi:hypothetical protein BpOF4_15240 [Alkalihalophilus pseudofirmus OF4]|uniref:DUF4367 domain-containing protein n=1 Tax=Alkalihalophilus pseudofirmus (strain ATCC BAA-2126 / JCM 17055 / OF4) TaxID=398511 RepID=D3G012_ALKPO|nr:hypothetical protein [Alkalihalophilus pseudofirmus]ADC51097.1 hypothetical protein BpOF4_15240 [Alkalihalophilus pseudofirmus OF4]